jgi:hypothetical protein
MMLSSTLYSAVANVCVQTYVYKINDWVEETQIFHYDQSPTQHHSCFHHKPLAFFQASFASPMPPPHERGKEKIWLVKFWSATLLNVEMYNCWRGLGVSLDNLCCSVEKF